MDGAQGENRTARGREHTRARLVEAAIEVFAQKGLEGASVDDLVTAAGFTRGAFYSNFSSKQELFFAAHDVITEKVMAQIRQTLRETGEGVPALSVTPLLFERIRPVGRLWALLRAEAIAASLRSTEAREAFEASRHRLRGGMRSLLEEQFTAFGITPRADLDVLAETLGGLYFSLVLQENLDGTDIGVVVERGLPALVLGVSDAWEGLPTTHP